MYVHLCFDGLGEKRKTQMYIVHGAHSDLIPDARNIRIRYGAPVARPPAAAAAARPREGGPPTFLRPKRPAKLPFRKAANSGRDSDLMVGIPEDRSPASASG